MNFLEVIEELIENVIDFKTDFFKFVSNFNEKHDITLKESILRSTLGKESISLLKSMKECCQRIQDNLKMLEFYNTKPNINLASNAIRIKLNIRDLYQICETTLELYDKFIRKDLDPLKKVFKEFTSLIETFSLKLKDFSEKHSIKFPVITGDYPTLHKVVNLGFEITTLERIAFQEFTGKYKDLINDKYFKYLEFLKDPLDDRYEYQWVNTLINYEDSFSKK